MLPLGISSSSTSGCSAVIDSVSLLSFLYPPWAFLILAAQLALQAILQVPHNLPDLLTVVVVYVAESILVREVPSSASFDRS